MPSLTVYNRGAVRAAKGTLLADALRSAGVALPLPCGGRGVCGKCAVWVTGYVSAPDARELDMLDTLVPQTPPDGGYALRLACRCALQGDCTVRLPEARRAEVLTRGVGALPPYDGDDAQAVGIAVDIGTTTIAAQLYDLAQGKLLASVAALNRQATYGADVLSRIAHAAGSGLQALHDTTVDQLSGMMRDALEQAGVAPGRVRRVVVTGNTTMLHLAAGLDPQGIGVAPFTPQSLFGTEMRADRLLAFLPPECTLYFPRAVSAYVGADVTCGMLASGLCDGEGVRLLVDVGTNGEMALWTGEALLCCATAAGPAFEGAEISMGMGAAQGAVSSVRAVDGTIYYQTIGGAEPVGICGTGLVSAIGAMLAVGAIDATGAMASPEPFAIGDSGVFIAARDVRALQLAKAAIAAGIDALLHAADVNESQADSVLLAGGFGAVMNPEDAAGIGLLPAGFVARTRPVGNVALSGAAMMLMSHESRARGARLARSAAEIPLASSAYFTERYMEHMMFPQI